MRLMGMMMKMMGGDNDNMRGTVTTMGMTMMKKGTVMTVGG